MNLEELIDELLKIASVRGGQVPVKLATVEEHPSYASDIDKVIYLGPERTPTPGHVVILMDV